RVTLRPPVKLDRGVRIAVDQGQAITLRYTHCFAQSYMADYESDAGLIAHMKAGRLLVVEAIDGSRHLAHRRLVGIGARGGEAVRTRAHRLDREPTHLRDVVFPRRLEPNGAIAHDVDA